MSRLRFLGRHFLCFGSFIRTGRGFIVEIVVVDSDS